MSELPTGLLTLPAPGDGRLAAYRRRVALLGLRSLATVPLASVGARLAGPSSRLQSWLAAQLAHDAESLLAAASSQEVLPGLLCLCGRVGEPAALLEATVPALLGLLPRPPTERLIWERPVRRVPRVGGQSWHFSPPARALLVDPSGLELRLSTGERFDLERPGELPDGVRRSGYVHDLGPGLGLSLEDANPLAMQEDHPGKSGNAIDLGGRPVTDWTDALGQALGLIADALPSWSDELPVALSRLVPVGFEPELHLSASYREAPGLAYLTLHPSPLTLAEAIVHETQHGKLNTLSWLDPVLRNGRSTWTESPVRPDLRPLMGVMLAVHAFVPVSALHLGLVRAGHPLASGPDFARRRAQVLDGNARGLELVRSLGELTAAGERVLGALEALHGVCLEAAGGQVRDAEALPPG